MTKFPYHEAAELRTEQLWVCKNCNRAFPTDLGERVARGCCTYQYPCATKGCSEISKPHRTRCEPHMVQHEAEQWAKRERHPLNGLMIFSNTLERYFNDEGEAWTEAEDRVGERLLENRQDRDPTPVEIFQEIEAMRLVLSEQVKPPLLDAREHLCDWLPDEDSGGDPDSYVSDLAEVEKAFNEALSRLSPVYYPTDKALDLSCFAGPDGPFVKNQSAP